MRIAMGIAAFAVAVSTAAQADALLEQVIAGAKADQAIVWRVERYNTDMNDKGQPKEMSVATFDGSAPQGARWSLKSINGQAASKKDCETFSQKFNANGFSPTYGQIAELLRAGATKLGETATTAHYRITSLAPGTVIVAGYDLSNGLQADISIDTSGATPFVRAVRITAPKPFKPASIGRVDKLERNLTFARGPRGLPVLTESVVDAKFKVLVKSMTVRTHSTFQNQQPVMQTAQLGKAAGSR